MLKREHEILMAFVEKPWKTFTFKEIKQYSRKKSESYVFSILKKLVKLGVLKEEKAGNVVLYSLHDSEMALTYAGIVAEYVAWNKKHIPHNEIEALAKKIPTDFFVLLITGSYARNMQKKGSDIDIVVICDDSFNPKKVYAELKHLAEISIPAIHLYVFKESEFSQMLLDKEANYGKETAGNNLAVSGAKIYLRIVSEAIKHGFNG